MGQSPPTKKAKKELKPLNSRPMFSLFAAPPPPPPPPSANVRHVTSLASNTARGKGRAAVVEVVDLTEDDDNDQSHRPDDLWVDTYTPLTRDDLGVHPKKVQDVANWIGEAYNPKLAKYRRLLVMSGPTGAAKTATLRVLANEFDIDILEYRNSANFDFANDDSRESLVEHFTSFLTRAGMAPALDLGPDPDFPSSASTPSTSKANLASLPGPARSKRLILLEDLPNTSHYPTKLALRSALQQYLASPRVTCPLVLIISEALARPGLGNEADSMSRENSFRRDESVDARSVCGVEVLHAPACREISFNPIAVTIMKKALAKILDRVYSTSGPLPPKQRPSAGTLDVIIAHSNGDIRSALMSLQFLAGNDANGLDLSKVTSLAGGKAQAVSGSKKRKKGDEEPVGSKDRVKKLLQFVTSRESSLFVFHALGKVLYSKRWGESAEDDRKDLERPGILQENRLERLPRHLRAEWTRAPSKVDPDTLFAEAPVESDIFLSYLHHNYTQFTTEVEESSGILDGLSAADSLMRLEGEDWLQRVPLSSQYSFNTAVRSTLLNLPQPVPRRKQVLRKSELWDKLRLQRQNEDGIEEMYRKKDGIALVPPTTSEAGRLLDSDSDGDGDNGGGGAQRSRRCLATEVVPYAGVIRRAAAAAAAATTAGGKVCRTTANVTVAGSNAFFVEMATFPPVTSLAASGMLKGEALGEKELEDEDDDEDEDEDEEAEGTGKAGEEAGGEDDGELAAADDDGADLEAGIGELLIDPEDDIED